MVRQHVTAAGAGGRRGCSPHGCSKANRKTEPHYPPYTRHRNSLSSRRFHHRPSSPQVGVHPLALLTFGGHSLCNSHSTSISLCVGTGFLQVDLLEFPHKMWPRGLQVLTQQLRKVPCLKQRPCGFLGHDGVTTEGRMASTLHSAVSVLCRDPRGPTVEDIPHSL